MKNKIISITFVIMIVTIMILGIIIPDKNISISERRKLASFPNIKIETILNGEFFESLNNYLVEQFPLRDLFRNIKGLVSNKIFQKNDEDGIFIKDDRIYQLEAHLNEKSIDHLVNLINNIKVKYIKTNNIYYSIIPDKNYYINDDIPKLDYEKMEYLLNEQLKDFKYINIFQDLQLNSYYKTDIHWKQEKLNSVIDKLKKYMNFETDKTILEYQEYQRFYGALYGRIANNVKPDVIKYLINKDINQALVYDYEKQSYRNVYEKKDLNNVDSYDIYLGGAKALLIIENKQQTNEKELILFRDSFGSSLAPLLISSYSKITLIDLRYLNSNMLEKIDMIEFNENQDILFMYSVPVINNSFTLK